jgi:hypothetical protein
MLRFAQNDIPGVLLDVLSMKFKSSLIILGLVHVSLSPFAFLPVRQWRTKIKMTDKF